ncbi:VG15 protein [Nocardiopsis alba]
MATTQAGAVLTEGHRLAQLGVLAAFIDSFTKDWQPDVPFNGASFVAWLSMIAPDVQAAYRLSANAANRYYAAFREAEGVGGDVPRALLEVPDATSIVRPLATMGADMADRLLAAGATRELVSRRVLTALGLQMTRQVLAGGRDAMHASMSADDRLLGYQRVASGRCCAFCAMLAARGPVYSSRGRAGGGRSWHPGCKCTTEPVYSRATNLPDTSVRYEQMWSEVGTGNLNDFRRYLERPELYLEKESANTGTDN